MLCIYGCFRKNGGFPQSPPQVLIIFSRKTHGPVGETHPFYRKSPFFGQSKGWVNVTNSRLWGWISSLWHLCNLHILPMSAWPSCPMGFARGEIPGKMGPRTLTPQNSMGGMNRNIKLLVKLHILDWYLRKGGFCGWDLFDKSFFGVSTRNGWNGWMKKDEKGKVSKW